MGFTSPRPSEEELVRLYDEAFYGSYRVSKKTMNVVDAFFFRGRRRQIELHKKPGRLLDVGCGSGRFVCYMAKHGWDTIGYDFSPKAYELADQQRNGRVRIIDGKLSDHELPEHSFDVITLWQVFEHIAEPLLLLVELRRLLRPDGLLVIAVPNIESFQATLTGKRWWGLDIPRHLSHYSPQSLHQALKSGGFDILRINHFSYRYAPYALFHSLLDRFFTRRDFLSDLAKRSLPTTMNRALFVYNIIMLVVIAPILFPPCIIEGLLAPVFSRGGFIEAFATLPPEKNNDL